MTENISRKLGLGTAQFGMAYGVASQTGRIAAAQLQQIIVLAQQNQITIFDTAPAYGQSEAVLGEHLPTYNHARVVTKTPHFQSAKTTSLDVKLLRSTFDKSLKHLCMDCVYGLLLHRGTDLLRPDAQLLWNALETLKAEKKVERLGVSVYTPEELNRLLSLFPIDVVQLPMNILDQRFHNSGLLAKLDSLGIDIHVRSVFLQGVLLTEPDQLPAYFVLLQPFLTSLRQEAKNAGVSMLELALGYVLRLREINTVLVGVNDVSHLQDILKAVRNEMPTNLDWDRWAIDNPRWTDPRNWKLR